MNIPEFVAKWKSSALTERASVRSWFNDICHVLGYPTPTDIDIDGDAYTFERGTTKTRGGNGWADVWMRRHFAWEFIKYADLNQRTLTNLYNERPTWLRNLHAHLDRAVWSAYGWPEEEIPSEVVKEVILERLLEMNLRRSNSISPPIRL